MAISLKDPEADRLARQLAALTGETLTEAISNALRERLARLPVRGRRRALRDDLREIGRRSAAMPWLDDRPVGEILGYDDGGQSR